VCPVVWSPPGVSFRFFLSLVRRAGRVSFRCLALCSFCSFVHYNNNTGRFGTYISIYFHLASLCQGTCPRGITLRIENPTWILPNGQERSFLGLLLLGSAPSWVHSRLGLLPAVGSYPCLGPLPRWGRIRLEPSLLGAAPSPGPLPSLGSLPSRNAFAHGNPRIGIAPA